jgi:hypothetical protein
MNRRFIFSLAACFTLAAMAAYADGPSASPSTSPTLDQKYDDLQKRVQSLQDRLDSRQVVVPAAANPTSGPSGGPTLGKILFDATPLTLPGDVTAGYDKGFYIQQGDEDQIKFNALFDLRYTFAQATNKTSLTNTALGADHLGDSSGFNLNDAQLTASGYLFKHGQTQVFYKFMGNFGTLYQPATAQNGSFIANEFYGGFAFDDGLRFRAGSVVVPLTPLRGITNYGGLTFPDVSDAALPFLPGLGLGADVYGTLLDNTVTYDLLVCNGSNGEQETNSTQPLDTRDNRLGVYTRGQWAFAGNVDDFRDESDVEGHDKFVGIVGGGFGYESQNPTATAYPGPQTTLGISGLSSATGVGFGPKYTVNGNVFRYVGDVRFKYQGFSFFGEALYQHIASETPTFIPGWPEHSIGETGYFAQAGYFVIPRHLEIAGRFGQLYTNGLHHEMDEYTVGVNYYFHGQNAKLQLAETYIPRQAALTNNNGSIANTQDWVTQLQFQLKF